MPAPELIVCSFAETTAYPSDMAAGLLSSAVPIPMAEASLLLQEADTAGCLS